MKNLYSSLVTWLAIGRSHFVPFLLFGCLSLTSFTAIAAPPSADPLPDLGPFACYTNIPIPDINVVTGETTDCGGPVTVTFLTDSPNPGCSGTVIRTYQLEDTCGIITLIQQNIFINDNIAPTASPLTPIGPYGCYSNIPAPNINLVLGEIDNCGGVVTVAHFNDSPNPGCSGTVIRRYVLSDACGNTALISQNIAIADVTPPVVTCPPPFIASCPADFPAPNPASVSWTDNCGTATVTHVSDDTIIGFQQNGDYCTAIMERIYRVTDPCGNQTQCVQIIEIQDICNPVYECPECEDIVPHFDVDFTLNPDSTWVSPLVVRNGRCCAQTGPPPPRCIHFTITLPPSVVAISFNIASGAQPSGSLFYQIGCDEVHQVGDTICLTGGATYELTFCKPGNNQNTYSIESFTGNLLPDTIMAQVDCAVDIIAEGIVESTAVWNDITGGGMYNSYLECLAGCLNNTFTPDSNAPPFIQYEVCGDAGTLICGQPVDACDTIAVFVNPEVVASVIPNPATYCINNIGTLTGSAVPTGSYSMQWFNGPNGTGTIVGTGSTYTPGASGTYSFVVSDLLNNFNCPNDTVNVPVTIIPLPQFNLGPDTAVCTSATVFFDLPNGPTYTWSPTTGVTTGADASQFTVTGSTSTTYTVTATTPQGCTFTDTWAINVVSCTIDCPEQFHCSAGDIIVYQTVTAFLAAGGVVSLPCSIPPGNISLIATISDGGSCPETITHTYEIEDICGNIETCDVVITLNDIIPPVWNSSPAPIGPFNCTDPVPVHENLTANDNCSVIINTSIDPFVPDPCNGYSITLRWTLMDSCGNSAPDQTLVVNFLPQAPPVFINPPANTTITCENVSTFVIPNLAYDNGQTGSCQIIGSVPGVLNGPINECGGQFSVAWNYTDVCGRTINHVQTVTVTDDIDPVITCLGNLSFQCSANIPPAFTTYTNFINGGGSASDNCGLLISSFMVSETDNGTCPRTITRTYSIADSCGNTAQCVQTITVDDQQNPIITCPGNLIFQCVGNVPPAFTTYTSFINGGGSASDNCGLVQTTFTVSETNSGTCPRTITRTYSIADSCGNTGQCVQTITVDDQINPIITCPGNQMFECAGDVPLAFTTYISFINGGGSASDNCGLVQTTFSVTETNNGTCPRTIVRTYSIADSCGNIGQCIQTITVDDQQNPIITCPGNEMFECAGDVTPAYTTYTAFINGGGSASDNCELVETSFTVVESDNGTCPRTITRTYSIADSCGNIGQCIQTITVDDQQNPIITCPGNLMFNCITAVPPAPTTYAGFLSNGGNASDNCGLVQTTFSVSQTNNGTCPRTITRIYTIADSCGNVGQCTQTITVDDNQNPVITCPGNQMFQCSSDVPPAPTTYAGFISNGGSASDNCGLVQSTFSVSETDNGTCPRTIIRTYTIADSCGNTGQCVQTITVDDQQNPIITCPGNLMFECTGDIPPAFTTYTAFISGGGSASDNCGLVQSTFAVTETDNGTCPRTVTRTYSIADSCGNTGQCVQTITIDDQENPVITCPGSLSFECNADVPPALTTFTSFINGGGSASDNCGLVEPTFTLTETDNGTCPRTITRIYTIADSCGNTGQCVQTITVDDQQNPVITCPANGMYECSSDVPPALTSYTAFINGGGSASDNCGLIISSFSFTQTDNGTCPRTITRVYTIADSCGNIGQCTQTIIVDDQENPIITCPGNGMFECNADIPPAFTSFTDFINGGGSATDNCELVETTFTVSESDNGTCPRTIIRIYSIADSCGNIGQCTQTITVDDQQNPVITCPGNQMFECTADVPPALTTYTEFISNGGSASDNCGLVETSFSLSETNSGTCPRTITRTYTIADSCGNTGQCVQTIVVDDQQNPVITCPGNQMFECTADVPPAPTTFADFINYGGSASDNCGLVEPTFSVTETNAGTCPRIITRIFTIADSCGNTGQCVETITVDDQQNPVIICPANQTFECSGDIPPAFTSYTDFINGGGSVSDNCGVVQSTFSATATDVGTCPRTVTRTYTIADSCGNTGQCIQTIIVDDQQNPIITCPGNLDFECIGDVPPAFTSFTDFLNGGGSASDNCVLVESTFLLTETESGTCPRTITRIYSIADSCNNIGQCTQTITVDDQINPVITCPGALTFECSGDVLPAFTTLADFINGGGSASDNCDLVESSFSMTETDNGTCPRTITRTYMIADSCDNIGQCVQTITVNDQVPPVITCPGNQMLECSGDIPPAFTTFAEFIAGGGSASDNCGLDEPSFSLTETDNGTCPRTIIRTYSIADSCNNTAQCVQTIIVDDQEPPTITCPGNQIFECIGDVPPAATTYADFINNGGSASDNCGLVEPTFTVAETDNGTCPRIIVRTYTIADSCGNTGQCVQTITVDDQQNPIITCPGDQMFECSGDIPPAFTTYLDFINGGGNASDNCGLVEPSFSVTESDQGTCPRIIMRTYTIADSCGNTGQCVQTFTVDDQQNPVITCPGNQSFECSADVPSAFTTYADFINGGGSASDNCGLVETTFTVTESDNGTCPRTIIRTYTIADSCGNTGQCIQTIIVDDQQNPIITCPGNQMFECAGDVPPVFTTLADFINGGGSASDNCGLVETTFTVTETDNGTCPRTLVRTYTIADSCANTGQCVQTIIVDDQVDPIITCPGNLQFECIGEVPPAFTTFADFINGGGSASDNCELIEASFSVTETDNGTCPRTITRIYMIADSCDNTGQCVQTITVDDQMPPVITCPGNETLECSGDIQPAFTTFADFIAGGGSASDNCGLVETSFALTETDNGTCPRTLTRTYSIADSCNNTAQCVQTITVDDQVPPVITCPGNEKLECSGDIQPAFTTFADFINGGGSASDNCGLVESTFSVTETDNGTCPRIIIRTYTIADSCDNTGQCVQTITVDDQENPIITCPANEMFECSGEVPPAFSSYTDFINGGGSASDNCGLVETTFSVTETDNGTCPRTITRTYSIADSCGNTGQCVQTITTGDQENPIVTCPADQMFECSGDIPPLFNSYSEFLAGGGNASDNCGLVESTFTAIETDNGTCPRTITRIYSIADSCGNTGECTQVVTVDDPIDPIITCPGDLDFECAGDVPPAFTTYADFINGGGSISDNCAIDEASFSLTEVDNGTCPRTIIRTYSIADSCNNTAQCTQTIIVDDQVDPIITCPGDLVLECSGDIPPALTTYADFVAGGGSASDNCELVESSFDVTESDNGICPRTIIRTYSIEDSCGRVGQCVQTIIVDDNVSPTASNPAPITIDCGGNIPDPDPLLISDAADNCSVPVVEFVSDVTDGGICPETITRTYSVTDECDNQILVTQTITIGDDIPPTASSPPPITLGCIGQAPAPDPSVIIDAEDNCSIPVVEFVGDVSDGGMCPEVIIRTYSVTDECDNQILVTQTITIGDDIPPTASNPPSIILECSGDAPDPDPSIVDDAADNCSVPVVEFVGDVSDGGICPEVIIRTYSVTDECDNQILVTQTITIGDNIPPTASDPAPIDIAGCNMPVPGPDITAVTDAADNCDVPVVEFVGDAVSLVGCIETTTRTYSITDACDNSITVTQLITRIVDITPPVFLNVPPNLNLECEAEIPPIPELEYTDNCSPGGTVIGTVDGPSGDPITVVWTWTATDDCGNTTSVSVTITVTETPIENNITDNFCNGDEYILPDGTTTTVGGTYGPYTFTSSSGCDSTVTLELTAIDPVTITISDGFCEGDEYTLPDGTTTTTGGSFGPYLFTSSEGCDSIVLVELILTNSVFTDLNDEFCEGDSYILPDGSTTISGGTFGPYTYLSQFGCDSIVTLVLTQIDLPEVDITNEGPVCISSGVITLTASPPGGDWSGSVDSDQFDPSVLGEGNHEIIYTITTGACVRADTINISVYELTLSCEALTEESFPGANDGSGSITVSGGIPPYNVVWTGPMSDSVILNQDETYIITGLTAGVYTIEVEDSTGCTAVCQFTIIGNPPCELVIDQVIPQDATCPGVNDGSITILASGSAPPFEYSLDGINYQGSNVFDMLAPGAYTVYVMDAMGCIESQDLVINSGVGPELSILEIVNASCGVNNGSILVIASGGSTPYMYSIDGVSYGFSNLFPGLFADDYLVYVIDENGCTDTIPAAVLDSDAPVIINIAVVNASCGLADGTITINATGGLGVLLYSINGGSSFQSSPVFTGLSVGTYEIVVQDEAFCQVTGTATIQEIGGPVITSIAVVPTSCEESDGSITITATGVPILMYSINGTQFQPSNIFQGLTAGNYIVTVRDGNGCIAVDPVTLNTTDGPQIQNVQHTNTTCGEDNGTITITASGGSGELTYFLNGDSYGGQNFMQDLPSGTYTIEVVDENGCSATEVVTINPSEGPDFDVYITPAHCGLPDGTIELDGVAGTAPFTYSINGGPFSANFTFVNLESEYYLVAIKDAKGCIYEQEVFLWEAPSPIILDVVITNPDCGDVNGSIEVTAIGNHLQYSIDVPNFQQSPIFYPVPPGTYTVTIRDTFRCTDTEVVVILSNPAPLIDNVILTNPECGVSNGAIQVIASGGVAPLTYSLNSGPFGSTNTFSMLSAGAYTVTVRGANGCEDSESLILNVVGQEINNTAASICEGGQFFLEGQFFTTAGNYSITLPGGAANGCDSLIILNLTVDTLPRKSLLASICQGDFYSIDGHNFNIGGHYLLDTIPGTNGCDTIRSLELTTTPLQLKYLDIDLCIGDSFVIGPQVFNFPGEYLLDTLSALFGCDSVRILRLHINPLPIAGAGPDKILACLSPTAVLEGSITGGTPLWIGPGISTDNQHELNPSVSIPGTYILTCTTPAGCEHTDTVVVVADPALVIADAGIGDYFSCDIDTVMLHAGPVGPEFHYQWSGPDINALNANQVSPIITEPGLYTLVVTNTLNGCVSAPDTVIITDITNEIIAIVQDPNSLDCFSTFVDLNATGSSIGSNLIYIWFNEQGEIIGNTPLLEISSGGLFSFVVLDTLSGCFDEDTVSVTDLISYPPVDAGPPQQLDCAHQSVILNAGAQNNLFNLVFQWTGPPGGILSSDTLLSITVGAPGMYYLEAEDTITRCKNIDSVLVSDFSTMPIADIQVTETITCRDSLALLNIGWSTSGPDITYSWTGPGFNGISAEFIEPSTVGLFTLTVFNNRNGCEAIDTVIIDWPPDLLDIEALNQVPICEGDASGSITITGVSGGVPEYTYSLNGQQEQSSPVFENLIAGTYTIAVTDGNGCTYTESVTINDGATLTIDIGIDINLVLGDSITLGAEISLPWAQVDSLVWTPANILSCDYCFNPVLYALHSDVITATVYSGGCFAEDMLELRVDIDAEFIIPNVFSPNGDGVNDFVTVFSDPRVKRVIRLEIFDRWGNNVFIGSDFPPNVPGLGWDGTFKNQPMNPAVFVYIAEVELINGDIRSRKGDITLLR